jgi:hypothetical protein
MNHTPAFWSLSTTEILQQLLTTKEGLTEDEASQRLARYGSNLLKPPKRSDGLTLLLAQFFRGVHAADLRGWRGSLQHPGYSRLVRDISERLGAAPQSVEPDKPKLSGSDWLRRAASGLREAAPVVGSRILPIIQGIANQSRAWVGGSTKRKMAVLTGVGVLAVLLAVIFYGGDNRPTLPIRQDTNIQGIVAQITKCNRSKGVLTIDMQFLNITDKKSTITLVNNRNYDQYIVMANSKRYLILT